MSPITHFVMGWVAANATPTLTKRERALVTWASVIPDLDGLGIVAEWATRNSQHPLNWWSDYHHILGHNIGLALLVSAVGALLAKQKLRKLSIGYKTSAEYHLGLV